MKFLYMWKKDWMFLIMCVYVCVLANILLSFLTVEEYSFLGELIRADMSDILPQYTVRTSLQTARNCHGDLTHTHTNTHTHKHTHTHTDTCALNLAIDRLSVCLYIYIYSYIYQSGVDCNCLLLFPARKEAAAPNFQGAGGGGGEEREFFPCRPLQRKRTSLKLVLLGARTTWRFQCCLLAEELSWLPFGGLSLLAILEKSKGFKYTSGTQDQTYEAAGS